MCDGVAADAARRSHHPETPELPREPGVLRRALRAHPRWVDVGIASLLTLPVCIGVILLGNEFAEGLQQVVGTVAGALVAGGALLWRRRFPLAVTCVIVAVLLLPTPYDFGAGMPSLVALVSLGIHAPARRAWIGFAVTSIAAVVDGGTLIAAFDMPLLMALVGIALSVALNLAATLGGISLGNRNRYVAALIGRAEDLARERDQRAKLAAADERARIAREMHDVVSHSVTVMVTLSEGAAARAATDPAQSADAMRNVAEVGREALGELRKVLGVLRESDEAPSRQPQPDTSELPLLIARFRDAGLPVTLTTSGPPLRDPGVALAVYRIVQEALTNALRHAKGASRVTVTLVNASGQALVHITDDGAATGSGPHGAGRGLIGIRERAATHGGSVTAGPLPGRGWRIEATIPLEENPR